jgi:DNA polymerase III epsilon subunit-like protein
MAIRYIGLDFETSGTDPWGDAVPIQIGIATWASSSDRPFDTHFEALIGKWVWGVDATWDEESFAIHGITQDELAKARFVWQVDILAAASLIEAGLGSRMWNVMVGWNVAGFDRQFITRWMPNLNRLFSYRTVDLNALVFARAGTDEQAYKKLKEASKVYAAERMGGITDWHDALYDAQAALHSFEFLRTYDQSQLADLAV